jgi:chitinase
MKSAITMQKISGCKALLILILICFSNVNQAQFRVIGYLPLRNDSLDFKILPFQKLTHLNIAFINPDSSGQLIIPPRMEELVNEAHSSGVKVMASIGGGSPNPYYARLLLKSQRKAFIEKLFQLCINYNLDGIDVDLENDAIDEHYAGFIKTLSGKLRPAGKLLTAALATWNGQLISKRALRKFDFVNIMSYDQTGPWRPENPGPHSTFSKAEEDLKYWTVDRGLPKNKVNLGLPFYGYCFGTKYGQSMSYVQIVSSFPGSENQDFVDPETGGTIYYNGSTTIRNKTSLALQNAGGVMIWQILQDAPGTLSLLQAIQETITRETGKK